MKRLKLEQRLKNSALATKTMPLPFHTDKVSDKRDCTPIVILHNNNHNHEQNYTTTQCNDLQEQKSNKKIIGNKKCFTINLIKKIR